MPAVASLEELEQVQSDIEKIKAENAEFFSKIQELLKTHRKVGYKNICKLILEETTPKKLKGLE